MARKIEVRILGDASSLNRAFGSGLSSSERFAKGLRRVGTLAGVGITAGLYKAAKATVEFDKGMRNVNSIAGLSEPKFQALSRSVLKLAGKTAQAPQTLAAGLYDLVSSGFNAKQSMLILASSAKAATAGLTTTEISTKAVAAVLNAYHLPAQQAANVSDTLFQTVNRGVISFEQLSSTIGDVLPFASSLGVSLREVGASVSTMTKEGIGPEETMTRIKNVMVAMLKPGEALSVAIRKTGAASGEALVKQKGYQGALEAVLKTTDGTKSSVAKLFPNIRALGGVLALTGKNARTAHGDLQAFQDVTGATDKALKEQSKSVSYAWQKIKAQVSAAAISVGSVLVPALADGLGKLGGFLRQIKEGTGAGGRFAANVTGIARAVAGVSGPAARAALSVGKFVASIALTRTGMGTLAGAAGGFAAFKVAAVVAPGVMKLGSAMSFLALNARTAPSIAAFFAEIGVAAGPVGIATAAFVALGAAIGFAATREDADAAATRRNSAAKRDLKKSIDALHSNEGDTVDKRNAARQSTINLLTAEKALTALRSGGASRSSAAYRQAELDVAVAIKQNTDDHRAYAVALQKTAASETQVRTSANSRLEVAGKNLAQLKKDVAQTKLQAQGHTTGSADAERYRRALQRLAAGQGTYNKALTDFGKASRVASIAALDQKRIAAGQAPITAKNAAGYQFLAAVLQKMPASVRTRYLLDGDQAALASMGNLSAHLIGLGRQRTVTRILADADSAKAATLAFKAILAGVPLKTVAKVLAHTTGKAEVDALVTAISHVRNKSVDIVTRLKTIGAAPPAGGAGGNRGGGPARPRASAAQAGPGLVFPAEEALAGLDRLRAKLQVGYDRLDQMAERAALKTAKRQAKLKLSHAKRGDRADAKSSLKDATKALRDFNTAATRARALAKIDVKVSGLERLKAFRGAIADIRTQIADKLNAAVEQFGQKWDTTIGATIDRANSLALDGFDKGTESLVEQGAVAQELARAKAEDAAAAAAAEDAANAKALADAIKSGDAEAKAAAEKAIADTARARWEVGLEAGAQREEAAIRAQRSAERQALEDLQAAQRQSRRDAEVAAYAAAEGAKLGALASSLANQTISYAKFALDVSNILAPLGLAIDLSPEGEAAINTGPGAALTGHATKPKKPKPKPKKPKPKRKRAIGGHVDAGMGYIVNELGRETFYPAQAGRIGQASETARAGAAGGGGNVYIQKAVIGSQSAAKAMADRLNYRARYG